MPPPARAPLLLLLLPLLPPLSSGRWIAAPSSGTPTLGTCAGRVANAHVEQTEWAAHARGSMRYLHMPSIAFARTQDGEWRVVVAWQASSSVEGGNDQELFVTSSDLSLKTWRAPRRLPGTPTGARWAPCLHQFRGSERLHLFYAESRRCYRCASARSCPAPPSGKANARRPASGQPWRAGGDIRVATSADAGLTWRLRPSPLLTEASQGNRPKVLANGPVEVNTTSSTRWVLPFWRQPPRGSGGTFCKTSAGGGVHGPETHGVLVSDDRGETWSSHGAIAQKRVPLRSLPRPDAGDRIVEGALVGGDGSDVFMLFRTTRNQIYRSQGAAGGTKWTVPAATRLHNPGSKVSALRAPNGDVLIVHNDHPWRAARTRTDLTLTVSHDGARKHFKSLIRFETRRSVGTMFHYPSLAMHPEDCSLVYVVYGEFGKGVRVRRVRLRYDGNE